MYLFETSFLSSFSHLLSIEPQYKLYKAVPFKCHVDLVNRVLLHFCMYSLHMGLLTIKFFLLEINNISFSLFWLLIVMMLMLEKNIHADVDSLPIVAHTDPHLFSVFFRASKDMLYGCSLWKYGKRVS